MLTIVLDTNVLVSALIARGAATVRVAGYEAATKGIPGQILSLVLRGYLTLLYDDRILAEYEEVLGRRKFSKTIDREDAKLVLEAVRVLGKKPIPQLVDFRIPDPDDRMFLEVAFGGNADVLVTGNLRHFPVPHSTELLVVTPRELIDLLATG